MKRFNGPVYPISPSFDENEKIEFKSTSKYIDYLSNNGVKIIMTTAGTSQFNLLTNKEIRELNLTVSRFKGQKILGLPQLSTLHLLKEIEYLNNNLDGDDISLLILFPERYYSDDQIVQFFEDVCIVSNFPILVHGNLLKKGMGGTYEYSKPLLSRLSEIDGFIGIKEEASNIMHSTENISKNLEVIVAGGSMKRFWSLEPHGATTYLVGVGSFNPKWEEQFYNEYYTDMVTSKNIITQIENPLFKTFMKCGWHLSMRTALKHMGFIKSDRRPFNQPTEKQKQNIINALNKIL
jgi:dihydrodipicolinate synthase/N-acetylneuraminate lyase